MDRGFGDVCAYPPGSHGGIVVLRMDQPAPRRIAEAVRQLVATVELADLAGCVSVWRDGELRVRRPPATKDHRAPARPRRRIAGTEASVAASEVLRDRVGGMAVQLVAGAVVTARRLGFGVGGEVLHVAQSDTGIAAERDRRVP